MGQACAKSDTRSGADDMQPRPEKTDPNSRHLSTSGGSVNGSTSTYGASSSMLEEGSAELFYDGRNNSSNDKPIAIEDFTLLKVVGRGSFGKVYMAQKKDT